MLRITVHDDMTGLDLTGEWKSEEDCRAFYAQELGTEPEHVEVVMIEQELTEKKMKKYYRVEIVYTAILDMISSNTFTDYQAEKPESTTEHAPMKDTHKAWFENPVEAEKYRQQAISIIARR